MRSETVAVARLAEWSEDLEEDLFAACQDPGMQARLPLPQPYTRESAHAFVAVVAPGFFASGGGNFAVVDEEGQLLGSASVKRVAPQRGRVGYWVAPWARGRGVAVEAAELIREWAKAEGFSALELTIGEDNPASQRVAEKAGYRVMGRIESHQFANGVEKPTLLYERAV